jgi:hypothetical protein
MAKPQTRTLATPAEWRPDALTSENHQATSGHPWVVGDGTTAKAWYMNP